MDRVRPLKIENTSTGGSSTDFLPTEVNPSQDYLDAKGMVFDGSTTIYIDRSATELKFTDTILGTKSPTQLKVLEIPIFTPTKPFIDTGSTTYQVVARFTYRGTTELGSPRTVRAIVQGTAAGTNGAVRLFDVSNSVTLGTGTFTGTALQLITIPTSGWNANAAIIEIQLAQPSGAGNARLSGVSIQW